jgi:hypothetical protein
MVLIFFKYPGSADINSGTLLPSTQLTTTFTPSSSVVEAVAAVDSFGDISQAIYPNSMGIPSNDDYDAPLVQVISYPIYPTEYRNVGIGDYGPEMLNRIL